MGAGVGEGEAFHYNPEFDPKSPQYKGHVVTEAGTTYQGGQNNWTNANSQGYTAPSDFRSYRYGRTATGADEAAAKAWETGDYAAGQGMQAAALGQNAYAGGSNLLAQRTGDAQRFNERGAVLGDYWNQNQSLGAQNQTLGQLSGLEAQQGPSAAQAQLQQGTNQAMAGQLALARSGRGFGGNAAMTGQAGRNLAGIEANQANAAASLRAQEDAAWRQRQAANLGNVGAQQGQMASQQGQQAQADLNAKYQNQAQNDAMVQNMLGMGQQAYLGGAGLGMQGYGSAIQGAQASNAAQNTAMGIRSQEMAGGMAQNDANLRQWAAKSGYDLAQAQQNQQTAGQVAAGIATFGAALSDVRAKTNIVPDDEAGRAFARGPSVDSEAGKLEAWARDNGLESYANFTRGQRSPAPREDVREWRPEHEDARVGGTAVPARAQFDREALDAVSSAPGSFYEYQDPSAPGASPGQHYGPMAQDLAKTPAGASAVIQQPDGKLGVDTGRLALVNTGALSAQQKELDSMRAQLDSLLGQQEQEGAAPEFRTNYGFAR